MSPAHSETARLLVRWRQGDRKALEQILARDLPWIEALVRRRLGPQLRAREETVDLVQDAMVQVLRSGPRFVVEDGQRFRALLARMVENEIRDRARWHASARRDQAREQPIPGDSVLWLDSTDATPSEIVGAAEEQELLRLALELLEPDDRAILLLREYEKLPFPTVAERLGIAPATARKRFERVLPRLARVVGDLRAGRLDAALEASTVGHPASDRSDQRLPPG